MAGMPISVRNRQVTASSHQSFSTEVACFTEPNKVVREGTNDRRTCSSLSPSKQPTELSAVLIEEHLEPDPGWLVDHVIGEGTSSCTWPTRQPHRRRTAAQVRDLHREAATAGI